MVMLQSGPTHSLVAKFLQHSVVTCSTQISCCRGKMLQMRPQTDVCEPLMPRCVVQSASELLQLSGPTFGFTTREISMVGGYTENPKKNTKWSKLGRGGGAYTGMGACSGQYSIYLNLIRSHQDSLVFIKLYILYNRKLLREKTFANFAVWWLFAIVFSTKFEGMMSFGVAKAIPKNVLRKNPICHQFPKVFSLESFLLCAMYCSHLCPYFPLLLIPMSQLVNGNMCIKVHHHRCHM